METLVKRNGMLREETRPKATGFANECDAIIVENQTGSVRTVSHRCNQKRYSMIMWTAKGHLQSKKMTLRTVKKFKNLSSPRVTSET